MNGVQCYELFGGIAFKNHTFSFFIFFQCVIMVISVYLTNMIVIQCVIMVISVFVQI